MPHKPFLLIHLSIIILFFNTNLYAEKLKITPIKKPTLETKIIKKKITQGILKPKTKPKINQAKDNKKVKKIEKKEETKKIEKKIGLLLPKNKPIIVKKEIEKSQKKSKYYRQKDYIIAKPGVYAVRAKKQNTTKFIKGIANLGFRPTFNQQKILLEVHLFNFSKNLYNKYLSVNFIKFIRKEKKFKNIGQLKKQIKLDLLKAKKL